METDQLRQRWAKLPIEIITTLWPLGSVWPDKNSQMSIKSCPKLISIEKLMILTPLQKLLYNVGNWDKIFVATDFEWLPKVQKSPNLVTLIGIPTLQCLKYCILLYYTCVLCDIMIYMQNVWWSGKIISKFFLLECIQVNSKRSIHAWRRRMKVLLNGIKNKHAHRSFSLIRRLINLEFDICFAGSVSFIH